ncbi:MAG: acyltransferase family protein [Acidimicrobiales bacterium]
MIEHLFDLVKRSPECLICHHLGRSVGGDMEPRTRHPALDGIRGLAVIAVLLFHEEVSWAPGGFLGVDVFFALSGYLITGLLLTERAMTGRIDIVRFWSRRLRRLLPALLLVIGVVTIAWVQSPDGPPEGFRLDAVAGLGLVANWRFAAAGNSYFAAHHVPAALEHLWSLGIEEQFYLLWPFMLLGVIALGGLHRRWILLVATLGGAAASALLMATLAHTDTSTARIYFGTDTRAQGLLLGAGLAVVLYDRPIRTTQATRRASNVIAALGLAAVAVLINQLSGSDRWLYQGGFTLAAISAVAVIAAVSASPECIPARLLSLAPLRWLGLISYGVYLWHWPLRISLTSEVTGLHGTALVVGRMGASIALAAVSFAVVELPVNRRVRPSRHTAVGFASLLTTAAAIVALVCAPPFESPQPVAAAPVTTSTEASTTTQSIVTTPAAALRPPPPTTLQPPPTRRVAFMGDSVAQSLAEGLAPIGGPVGLAVINDAILGCGVARSGAYTLSGTTYGLAEECASWSDIWRARLARDRPHLVVVQVGRHEVLDREFQGSFTHVGDPAYDTYVAGELDQALSIAGSTGAPVVLLTAPYYRRPEQAGGDQWPENDPARANRVNDLLRATASRHPGVTVIELGAHTSVGGRYTESIDGVRLRRDGVHYSAAGCAWMLPWLAPQLRALVP